MSDSTTATVETLTAEVRSLMIGSRQVTMSVFNQLDTVPCTELQPFGRVRPKGVWHWQIHVVGRSTRDEDAGALVRSMAPTNLAVFKLRNGEFLPSGDGGPQPDMWAYADEADRDAMEKASIRWAELPLIVLAGLR